MIPELEKIFKEYQELTAKLAVLGLTKNSQEYVADSKRLSDLAFLGQYISRCQQLEGQLKQVEVMAEKETEPGILALAREEKNRLVQALGECEQQAWQKYQEQLAPGRADNSVSEMILEIRAGAGGDEAALFARDLFEMYQHYCVSRGWGLTLIHENRDELGG